MRRSSQRTRAPGGVVDVDGDAGLVGHVLFVEPDAGRAGDAFEDQRGLALVLADGLDEALLEVRVVEEAEILELVGHGLAGLLGHRVAALVVDEAAADDGLGHRLAAGAAHLVAGAFDIHRQVDLAGIAGRSDSSRARARGKSGQRLGQRGPRNQGP
jgi:hypothetical protein